MSALFLPLFLLVCWIILTGGTWWWIRRTPEPLQAAYDRGYQDGKDFITLSVETFPPGTSLQWVEGWNAGVEFAQTTVKRLDKSRLDASYDNGRIDEYRRWLDHPNFPDFRRRG